MKAFLVEASLGFFVLLVVMALVFRSVWARDMLRFLRNVLWAYVVMVVVLAGWHVYSEGF